MVKLIYLVLDYLGKHQRTLDMIEKRLERIEEKIGDEFDTVKAELTAQTVLLERILELLESTPEPAVDIGLTAGPVEEQPL